MKNFLLFIFITTGIFCLKAQVPSDHQTEAFHLNNRTEGKWEVSVAPYTKAMFYINTGVNKAVSLSFKVEGYMGGIDVVCVQEYKDPPEGGVVYYEGDGYQTISYDENNNAVWSKSVIADVSNGKVLVWYFNSSGTSSVGLTINFKTLNSQSLDWIGIGMAPTRNNALSVLGNSYFKGNVGIGVVPSGYALDVKGTIRGESLNLRSGTNSSSFSNTGSFTTTGTHFTFNKPIRIQGGTINSGLRGNLYLQTYGTTRMTLLYSNGNVGIGTTNPAYTLDVNGTIRTKEIIVQTGWADFVFDKDYQLPSLREVEAHIEANKHLPGIPSETEVKENGVSLGEMQVRLLQKIEELTLYIIEQDKKIQALENKTKLTN